MPSSYSNNLKLELIATGEQDGTWGNTTNTNLGTAIEQAIVGRAVVTFATDADLTLTLTTSNAAQDARAVYLVAQSGVSLTASRNLVVPTIFKNYVVKNDTTGSQNIVVKTSAGTGVTVPNGKTVAVYVDGTNVIQEADRVNTLDVGTLTSGNAAFTGTPTAPTAAPGTNTTQIATTAFTSAAITAATGSLGTMSTQNANNVAITGGSISGITDLTVPDGGTGRSSLTAENVLLGDGTNAVKFVAPGSSGNVLTSNGTTWASTAIPAQGIGVGQTWQNVTGSRSGGTTYTNNTGKPIMVSVNTNSTVNNITTTTLTVDGLAVSSNGSQGGNLNGVTAIVPAGSTYSVSIGAGGSLNSWFELR